MKNKYLTNILVGLSLLLMAAAIYFHNGYFHFVNEYIYSDSSIPAEFAKDKFYFMNKKLALKNRTIYGLCFLSVFLFFYNRKIANKQLSILLLIQCLVVVMALFFWIIRPNTGLIY